MADTEQDNAPMDLDSGAPQAQSVDTDGGNALESFTSPAAADQPIQATQAAASPPAADKSQSTLPSWDDALASGGKTLPTWDDALKQSQTTPEEAFSTLVQKSFTPARFTGQGAQELSDAQRLWAQKQPFWNIVKAFGQGYEQSYGQEILSDLSVPSELKKAIEADDFTHKGVMDGMIVPAAKDVWHAASSLGDILLTTFGTAPVQGFEAAASTTGEIGEKIGQAPGALMEAFPSELGNIPERPILPPSVAIAKAEGALESEAVFTGVKEPSESEAVAMQSAAQMYPEAYEAYNAPEPTAAPKTVHDIAREIDPVTFDAYDKISGRLDTYNQWYNDATERQRTELEQAAPPEPDIEAIRSSAPHADEIADLQEKLQNDPGNARQAARKQEALANLTKERDDFIQSEMEKQRNTRDDFIVGGMADKNPERLYYSNLIAKEFQDKLALSKSVSRAYRKAGNLMPEVPETEGPTVATSENQGEALGESATQEQSETPAAAEQNSSIAEKISKDLSAAGRSDEEAQAGGQILSAYYETRADRFKGKRGTAEDLFNADAPEIRAGRGEGKSAKGKWNDAKRVLTLFKSADASSFIHETGHHWLDDLMKDVVHPDAPDALKSMGETVKKYLGIGGDGQISTRQHEKFARTAERYFMEGIAPTRALDGVFSKYKQWLSKIYQVVDKLKAPITDDIRNVFDNLLSKSPESAVIAPEQVESTTPPGSSEGTAPQFSSQSPAAPDVNTMTPEQARTEGQGAAPSLPKKVTEAESVQQDSEGTVLPSPDAGLMDKAGNILIKNLNAPEDINAVLRQSAEENNDFMGARDVVTDAQVSDFAAAMGVKATEVNLKRLANTLGQGQLASKIVAARKLLIQSATTVRDAMAKAAIGTDADVIAYAQARARHIMIQGSLSAVTAEAGRALRAFRDLGGTNEGAAAQSIGDFLKTTTGKDLFQLRREAQLGAALDTPQKISKYIQDSKKPSFGARLLEYWTNGLISGAATHTTYATGNTILSLWKATAETGAAALVGSAHELLGREGSGIRLGEIGAQLQAAKEGIPSALSAAGKAFKSGVTTLLPGEEISTRGPLQQQGSLMAERIGNEVKSWTDLGSDLFGTVKGLRDSFIATGELIKAGGVEGEPFFKTVDSPLGSIPDIAIKGLQLPVGSAIRTPARLIAAIHSFFRTSNYSMGKAAIAYRTAAKEGLEGTAFEARVADIVQNPSEDIMNQSRAGATELTLMGEGGNLTKAISRLTNTSVNLPVLGETKLLKFIDPFVHIGSNVIDQSLLKRTVLGAFTEDIRNQLKGKIPAVLNSDGSIKIPERFDAALRDLTQGRMLVGTALAVTIGGLAAEGLVSGSGPSDPGQNAAWRLLGGNQPHSILIGDTWYDIHRLGPLGMVIGVAADMYEVAHQMGKEDASVVAATLMHAITQNVLDESFMRGPSEMLRAVTDSDRYGDAYVRNFLSSFVPFSVGMSQMARASDPYSRQARTLMDAIKMKIPGLSEQLYARRDLWGEQVANKEVLGPAGFSALYESKLNTDPVNQELLRLNRFPKQPDRKIRGIELTDQQYDDYTRISGRLAKMRLNSLVSQPVFSAVPDAQKMMAIKNVIEKSRETARKVIMLQDPTIMQRAVEKKKTIAKQ